VSKAIGEGRLVAAAVLSGNRNFEGRVNPDVKANYLASPPLVVAYALAGTTDIDLATEPLGSGADGRPVFLRDIWPSQQEVAALEATITGEMFAASYANVFRGQPRVERDFRSERGPVRVPDDSTYIQDPPFFRALTLKPEEPQDLRGAQILAVLGTR